MKLTGQKILISGGGTGIGFAIAQAFSALGNEIFICGRNEDALASAAKKIPGIKYFVCDITDEAQIKELADVIHRDFGSISILINNAGIAAFYDINDGNMFTNARREIETNYLGMVHLTEIFLPDLKQQPEAAVVNISSATAIVPSRSIPTYSASKAAVHMFSIVLRLSLQNSVVKVFSVMPPLVDTDFAKTQSTKKISPDTVANALIKGMRNDVNEIFVGDVRALHSIHRLFPNLAQRIMNTRIKPAETKKISSHYSLQDPDLSTR